MVNILMIDNYDSFTYNLYHLLLKFPVKIKVFRNDEIDSGTVLRNAPDLVVISPGPKNPQESGNTKHIIAAMAGKRPVFGVCLGMQAINEVFGGVTVHAPEPVHAKTSLIYHEGTELFKGLPSPFRAARYHSLISAEIPESLRVIAHTGEGLPMAVKHKDLPVFGVQFHPESFLTDFGFEMIRNLFSILGFQVGNEASRQSIFDMPEMKGRNILDIFQPFAGEPASALLLSGGDHDCARFSIIGYDPFCILRSRGDSGQIIKGDCSQTVTGDPFGLLASIVKQNRIETLNPRLPVTAGGIGYFAYEMKNYFEKLPQTTQDDLTLPDIFFCFYRMLLIHDRSDNSWRLCYYSPPGEVDDHGERIELFVKRITQPQPGHQKPDYQERVSRDKGELISNFVKSDYLAAVEKIRRYIIDGHIYQANLSQRFSMRFTGDPYQTFIRLYEMNPAPFYAYLNCGDFQIISTSPERFLYRKGDYVETRPIKGTRPRGKTAVEDSRLKQELLESPKDEAELSMIVDLMRNDISRVCRRDSVVVTEHKRVEAYTNVYHLVSVVQGRLQADATSLDLVKACFPGGSITGCPKIRSMEIIDEFEPHARGVYTGSIGYLSFHDSMDLNIAIRTSVVKDGRVYFNVGGGIVYDSKPEEEYLETLYKGESIMQSLKSFP
ncbi:MAG: aminodeoxychorismate synthase component I [Spirochaetota bacterium]